MVAIGVDGIVKHSTWVAFTEYMTAKAIDLERIYYDPKNQDQFELERNSILIAIGMFNENPIQPGTQADAVFNIIVEEYNKAPHRNIMIIL